MAVGVLGTPDEAMKPGLYSLGADEKDGRHDIRVFWGFRVVD